MNNADPQERASEIEKLVELNELNKATKRLMDFQKDFSQNKKSKREVISIRARYTELSEEIRGIGKTEDTNIRTTRLRQHILELVDSILEDYLVSESQITSVADTNLSQPEPFPLLTNFPIVQSPNNKEKNKTQYELAKENFRKNKLIPNNFNYQIVFVGENIDKRYRNSSIKFTLSNINISLKLGEITAVVGENGNGKTTLLRIIAGELATDSGKISYPCLTLNNQTDLYSIKQQIAYIPQQLPEW